MEIVKKEDLENVIYQEEMLSSQAKLYTCYLGEKIYVFKRMPYYYPDDMVALFKRLSYVNNEDLILPEILISDCNHIIGYLTSLSNFLPLIDLHILSFNEKVAIINCAKKAVISMHKNNIIHCDLHTANIMYKDGKCKIIDFDSCVYGNNKPESLTKYAKDYLKKHGISPSLDIFMFNMSTISFLYNISFCDVFNFDLVCNLGKEQNKVWQKAKKKEELTYDDFLINYY